MFNLTNLDELLKAVELQEEERRITCQKISENSKLLVENRLLQAKFSKLEIELSRAKALVSVIHLYLITRPEGVLTPIPSNDQKPQFQ